MKRMKVDVYEAADGWRWRLKSGNGRIVAESGEAYRTRRGVVRALYVIYDAAEVGMLQQAIENGSEPA